MTAAPEPQVPLRAEFLLYRARHQVQPDQVDSDGYPLLGYPEIAEKLGRRPQAVRKRMAVRHQHQGLNALAAGIPDAAASRNTWVAWATSPAAAVGLDHNKLARPSRADLRGMSTEDIIIDYGWWNTGLADLLDLPRPVGWVGVSPSASPRFLAAEVEDWMARTGRVNGDGEATMTPLRGSGWRPIQHQLALAAA